jgi:sterol desaturase/sphingolipid hydroxylase (fatty acid hydroxylase superfamily)
MAHHYYQGASGNCGVTASLWDAVFSTKLERRQRRPTMDAANR